MLISVLWAYWTTTKTTIGFTPFHLIHGIESVIPIECEILTLQMVLNVLPDITPLEQRLLHLEHLNEDWWASLQHEEAHKVRTKAHFDQ